MKLLTAGLIILKMIAISLLVSTYYGTDAAVVTCTTDAICAATAGLGALSKCCYYLRPTGSSTRICSRNDAD